MQKHNQRDLFIAGTKGYVEWNSVGNSFILNDYEKDKQSVSTDSEFSNDAMFVSQTSNFLKHFNTYDSINTLEAARASMVIVEAAKTSMANKVPVNVV